MASKVKSELHTVSAAPILASAENKVVLLRANRGRSQRIPMISSTKLNSSERGKRYRQKYRKYEEQLEQDVLRLQREVHELQQSLELRQVLPHQYPRVRLDEVRVATQVVYESLVRLQEQETSMARGVVSPVAESSDETRSAESKDSVEQLQRSPSPSEHFIARHQNSLTPLVFKLESVEIQGCSDSRIVVAYGCLLAEYQPLDIEMIFPVVRHNQHLASQLLAREVAFDCTYRFHTASLYGKRELVFVSVDVDAVGGLSAAIPNLHNVEALLSPLTHSDCFGATVEKAALGSRRSSINNYDRSPTLLAVTLDGQDYLPPLAAPEAMSLAFILS